MPETGKSLNRILKIRLIVRLGLKPQNPRPPEIARRKPLLKGKKGTVASDIVYGIFDSATGPVDMGVLVEKTGFERKKLYNILYRLKSQGKVRSVGKGVYSKVQPDLD